MQIRPEFTDLLASRRDDVLSVYLDVDPTKPEHQAAHPAYRIWLRNALRDLLDGLVREQARRVRPVADRALAHVETRPGQGRGLVLFAAPDLWREIVLPYPVPNRATYGRPDLVPLLWAVAAYHPYAILVVDREHARLVVAYLGQTSVVEQDTLVLDTSDWRFKTGRPPSHSQRVGVGAGRGAQRDAFEARVDDHVRRFWQGAADATGQWLRDLQIDRLLIGGPAEAASAVRERLPEPARSRVAALVPVPGTADLHEILQRTLPVAAADERRREADLVARIVQGAAAGTAVVGKAQTLGMLLQGQAMAVVADRDLNGAAWRCSVCRYVGARRFDRCPTCGAPVEEVPLAQVLPLLARQYGARLEVVGGPAAARLRPYEGLGAQLRYVPA